MQMFSMYSVYHAYLLGVLACYNFLIYTKQNTDKADGNGISVAGAAFSQFCNIYGQILTVLPVLSSLSSCQHSYEASD